MVQIIENWSDVSGKVLSVTLSTEVLGFAALTVQVTNVSEVPGFANLLKDLTPGTTITVLLPQVVAEQLKVQAGATIDSRVRRGGPNSMFAHPEHISVS